MMERIREGAVPHTLYPLHPPSSQGMRIRFCAAGCGGFGHESVCVCVILASGRRVKEGVGGEGVEEQSSQEVGRAGER